MKMMRPRRSCKIWSVVLSRKEVLDDLTNVNYIQSNSTMQEDTRKQSLVQEINDDANRDRVVRVMDLAFGEVRDALKRWDYDASPCDIARTDDFVVIADYSMRLKVNYRANDGTVVYVKDLTHEFLVDRVLEDWLEIHGKLDAAAIWTKKAEKTLESIKNAISKSVNIVQVVPMPFG